MGDTDVSNSFFLSSNSSRATSFVAAIELHTWRQTIGGHLNFAIRKWIGLLVFLVRSLPLSLSTFPPSLYIPRSTKQHIDSWLPWQWLPPPHTRPPSPPPSSRQPASAVEWWWWGPHRKRLWRKRSTLTWVGGGIWCLGWRQRRRQRCAPWRWRWRRNHSGGPPMQGRSIHLCASPCLPPASVTNNSSSYSNRILSSYVM